MANAQSIMFLPYCPPVLQWEQLGSCIGAQTDRQGKQSSSLTTATKMLQQGIHEMLCHQPWLLSNNHHHQQDKNDDLHKQQGLMLPPTHLKEYVTTAGRRDDGIYSLGDFYKQVDKAAVHDVQISAEASLDGTLDATQMQDLKQHGRFAVPSVCFHDQRHVWQVTPYFYSGTAQLQQDLQRGTG